MTYILKKDVKVSAKEFASHLINEIMDRLEQFECMPDQDLADVAGAFSEISEYVKSIKEQCSRAEDEAEIQGKLQATHQRTESAILRGE